MEGDEDLEEEKGKYGNNDDFNGCDQFRKDEIEDFEIVMGAEIPFEKLGT